MLNILVNLVYKKNNICFAILVKLISQKIKSYHYLMNNTGWMIHNTECSTTGVA